MATSTPTEILLGCDPIVRVQVIEDNGNLVLILNSTDGLADIDGVFFNLNNDAMAPDLTIFPEVDTQDVVDFTVAPGTLNQLNNGAQIQEQYDVRVEFGVEFGVEIGVEFDDTETVSRAHLPRGRQPSLGLRLIVWVSDTWRNTH